MDIQKVENYLSNIETLIAKIRNEIYDGKTRVRIITNQTDSGVVVRQNGQVIAGRARGTSSRRVINTQVEQTLDFANRIINDPSWPAAVPIDLICEPTHEDYSIRADSVLDIMVDSNMSNKRFLDFGCGLGYMARQSLLRVHPPREAVGYDPKRQSWERFRGIPNLKLTDQIESLEPSSFDIILAYDVLDHCERSEQAVAQMKRLLAPDGVIYTRCHPWSSRTGGHMYNQINKAYIHLALNDVLFEKLGYEVEPIRKIIRPLMTYKEWFTQAGLKVLRENVQREVLENYFKDNLEVKKSLYRHWDGERNRDPNMDELKVEQILEINHCDYILGH